MKIIAGNCVLEDRQISDDTAQFLNSMSKKHKFELIYKSSWCKDNRSDATYFTGPDVPESVEIFKELKEKYRFKILTDVHNSWALAHDIFHKYVDVYQIPAYLCMQTSLTNAVADYCYAHKKQINIKKGQFLHPEDVINIIRKIVIRHDFNPDDIWITERGTCFGYRDLVVDPRSLQILKEFGYPVYLDVGHSVRKYGIPSCMKDGGNKEFVNTLGKVALALDCNIFVEVHPNPEEAKCDSATQLSFEEFESFIEDIKL